MCDFGPCGMQHHEVRETHHRSEGRNMDEDDDDWAFRGGKINFGSKKRGEEHDAKDKITTEKFGEKDEGLRSIEVNQEIRKSDELEDENKTSGAGDEPQNVDDFPPSDAVKVKSKSKEKLASDENIETFQNYEIVDLEEDTPQYSIDDEDLEFEEI